MIASRSNGRTIGSTLPQLVSGAEGNAEAVDWGSLNPRAVRLSESVAGRLESMIVSGELAPGRKLPAERDLDGGAEPDPAAQPADARAAAHLARGAPGDPGRGRGRGRRGGGGGHDRPHPRRRRACHAGGWRASIPGREDG